MMDDLEKQLKSAFAKEDAPEWFEARVMAATRRVEARKPRPRWQWLLATAMAAMLAVTAAWQHQREVEERAAGEAAKAQLELALKITSVKLQQIQKRIDETRGDD